MKNGKLQIGIVGCGGIATQKHCPALTTDANKEKCDLVAFCDIIPERAEKMAAEFGVEGAQVCTDYKELLANPDIDVVHVCTPNVAHCPITVDAFAAGKHVYCEKPMAHNTADAKKMIDAWKASGKQFTIGYQNRSRDEVMNCYKSCEKGDLGDIYYAEAHAVRRRAVPTWGVFPNKALQGGGPLIDIGTHALDITLWCMDNYEPASVTGSVFYKLGHMPEAVEGNLFGPWDPETYEVEDSAFGFIKMKNGATIVLKASWALNQLDSREASTTLCGTLAGAEVRSGMSYAKNELIYNRSRNGQMMQETISPVGQVAFFGGAQSAEGIADATQWLDAVINGTEPLVKPEQAFVVTQILEAIYESDKQGKEIIFE